MLGTIREDIITRDLDMDRTLAPEICDRTIDFLHDDRQTLRACTLVCKSWLHAASYHLFSTITVDPRRCDFAPGNGYGHVPRRVQPSHLRLEQVRRIKYSVRRLRIEDLPLRFGFRGNICLEYSSVAVIEDMVTRFPNLRMVHLALDSSLKVTTHPDLSGCNFSRPVDLPLDCFFIDVFPTTRSLAKFARVASIFSDIRALKVRSMDGHLSDWETPIDPRWNPHRHNIKDIQLFLTERQHAPAVSTLIAYLANVRSVNTLSITEYSMHAGPRKYLDTSLIANIVAVTSNLSEAMHSAGVWHLPLHCQSCHRSLNGIVTPSSGPHTFTALRSITVTLSICDEGDEEIFSPWVSFILQIPQQLQRVCIKFASHRGHGHSAAPVLVSAEAVSQLIRSFAWQMLDDVVDRQPDLNRLEIKLSILGHQASLISKETEDAIRAMSSARVLRILHFV